MRGPRAVEYESRHDGLAFVSSPHAELGRRDEPDQNRRPEPRTSLRLDVTETDPSPRVSSTEAEPSLGECLEPQRASLDHFDADEVSELTFLRKVRAKAEAAAIAVWGRAVPRDAQLEAAGRRRREPNISPARAEIPNGAFDEPQAAPGRTWAASRMRHCVLQRDHVPKKGTVFGRLRLISLMQTNPGADSESEPMRGMLHVATRTFPCRSATNSCLSPRRGDNRCGRPMRGAELSIVQSEGDGSMRGRLQEMPKGCHHDLHDVLHVERRARHNDAVAGV